MKKLLRWGIEKFSLIINKIDAPITHNHWDGIFACDLIVLLATERPQLLFNLHLFPVSFLPSAEQS